MKGKFDLRVGSTNLILPKQPHNDVFLQIMDKVFYYASWFGVMSRRSKLWKCWSLVILILLVIIESAAIWKVIKALAGWASDTTGHRSVTARLAGTIFYAISLIALILTSRLSMAWKDLAAYWTHIEKALSLNIPPDERLRNKMIGIICFMAVFCFAEHVMSIISLVGLDCPLSLVLMRYTLKSHGFIMLRIDYSTWLGFLIFTTSTMATLLWSYQDLLIVLISMGLTSRYDRLNKFLFNLCRIEKNDMNFDNNKVTIKLYTWRKLREAYVKQAAMVRKIDNALGTIVLTSCFCNFYFICLQLFMGITVGRSETVIRRVYYVVSLGFLCVRIGSIVLTASNINVYSKSALKQIYACEGHYYNVEMERLQNQLTKDYVALSGNGFFYLNKNILLKMAGAILTYELVLIQYDSGGDDSS